MSLPLETARFEALKKLAAKNYGKTTRAENEVLRRSASTENDDPQESDEQQEIRAEFLRWLATDKDAAVHIDALGIRVANMTVATPLELDYCKLTFPLRFDYCIFLNALSLVSAELPALSFFHCETGAAVYADGLKTSGSVLLHNLEAYGVIRLVGAQIGGSLDCGGATLNPREDAFVANGAKIGTYIFLRTFYCNGIVRLQGAEIGRDLDCSGATLKATGNVLFADGATIKGNVFLRDFSSPGAIRFVGTQIDGDLDCNRVQVVELYCREMRVAGDLIWVNIRQPSQTNLRLSGATIGTLHDDQASWPQEGKLHILDFIYRDLALHNKSTPDPKDDPSLAQSLKLTVEDRIKWLMLQPKVELVNAQPWMQVANLLETNGDADGAKQVIYEYRRQQMVCSNLAWRLVTLPYHRLEEQPLWIGVPIITLGAVGSFLFWRAQRIRAMAPTDEDARTTLEKSGKLPASYPPFNPIVYALEIVLPVIKLGQDSAWTPDPQAPTDYWVPERPVWLRRLASRWRFTRYVSRLDYHRLAVLRWTLILLGWAFALILAAAIGSRFKP